MANMHQLMAERLALLDYVWERLGVRKHLLGRDRVNNLTVEAISRWPVGGEFWGEPSAERLQSVANWVSRRHKNDYGFIWMAILSAIVGQIVRLLLEWWLDSDHNKESMRNMRMLREPLK